MFLVHSNVSIKGVVTCTLFSSLTYNVKTSSCTIFIRISLCRYDCWNDSFIPGDTVDALVLHHAKQSDPQNRRLKCI
jgi:hypothetical protein